MSGGAEQQHDGGLMDRTEAARLLRKARGNDPSARIEAIDWLFVSCPDRRAPRRLKVATLIANGEHEAARAAIARGLLNDPNDTILLRLKAESLLAENRPREADRAIHAPLERWPRHLGTLRLAARIASAVGDHTRAAALLLRAETERPDHQEVRAELTQALLDAGRPDEAAVALEFIEAPSAVLAARVLHARGRMLEAVDVLEAARQIDSSDDVHCELIALLETTGDSSRLRCLLDEITSDQPGALVRAGIAWLSLGAFRTAADRMAHFRESSTHQRTALSVLTVASAMLGRDSLAEKAFLRLQQTTMGADPALLADLWRRALTARLFSEQCSPQVAGADRNASLLQPLLESTLHVFSGALLEASRQPATPGVAELERHRALCLEAMGRTAEATRAHERSLDVEPPRTIPFVPATMEQRKAA